MDKFAKEFQETLMNSLKDELKNVQTNEEAEKIIKKYEKIDVCAMYQDAITSISTNIFSSMKETMYEEVMKFRADEQEFVARQEQKWYKAFTASEALYIMSLECGESYGNYVSSLDDNVFIPNQWTFLALQHIHGRALQIYLEIITLMKNGFADGAYSRWRSLYELSVIASFIKKYGEDTAKSFVDAADTNERYDWAKVCKDIKTNKKHIYFKDIEKVSDLNITAWEDEYNLANQTIHASSQGTFGRLGKTGNDNVILAGRSDYGITVPGEHAAISLVQISTMLFTIFPESDALIQSYIMNKWIDVIRETYFKSHDEIFPNDKKLWGNDCIEYNSDNDAKQTP